MAIPVVSSPEADEDIRRIDSWWREQRPAAPDLFVNELSEAFALLAETPEIGHRYARPGIPGVRRLLLRATRYHVYYVFDGNIAAVLSVWSAVRGRGPRLRR
jgi:plasmid stabilization system protein ParE